MVIGRVFKTGFAVLLLAALAACVPTRSPPASSAASAPAVPAAPAAAPYILGAALGADTLTADDGVSLPLHSWTADEPVRAVVVAVHGMNDYGNVFDRPARLWEKAGITTYALDQRGFGQAVRRGRWYGGDRMAGDVLVLARLARARHPGIPVFLLGESMGGAVAVLAAARAEPGLLSGLVLSAPAIWGVGARAAVVRAASVVMGALAPGWTAPPLSTKNASTDDPVALKRIREDKLIIHQTRFDTLAGIVDLMGDAQAGAAKVTLPTLLLLGDLDGHVPRDGIAALLRRMTTKSSPGPKLAFYEGGRHLLMRSLNGDRVSADIASWVLAPDAPLPSGADARARACPQLLLTPAKGCAFGRTAAKR
nr:alpha/beta fold hydrolase [Azospirillum doebereinerae]